MRTTGHRNRHTRNSDAPNNLSHDKRSGGRKSGRRDLRTYENIDDNSGKEVEGKVKELEEA